MSPYTTTLAVYLLARGFAGLDALVWIGAAMTVYPVFFAVMENDLRKVLAYSTNNQIGFMVCAVGIGTPLALNGAAAPRRRAHHVQGPAVHDAWARSSCASARPRPPNLAASTARCRTRRSPA